MPLPLAVREGEGCLVEEVAELNLDIGEDGLDDLPLGVILAPDEAVDGVALGQEVLGEIGAVLAGYAGDERCRHGDTSLQGRVGPPAGPRLRPRLFYTCRGRGVEAQAKGGLGRGLIDRCLAKYFLGGIWRGRFW